MTNYNRATPVASDASDVLWDKFGPVTTYLETFAGPMSMFVRCPYGPRPRELINDLNGLICNFWRAFASDPKGVAKWLNAPGYDIDQQKLWLQRMYEYIEWAIRADPMWHSARAAGYWFSSIAVDLDYHTGMARNGNSHPYESPEEHLSIRDVIHPPGNNNMAPWTRIFYDEYHDAMAAQDPELAIVANDLFPCFQIANRLAKVYILSKRWDTIMSPSVMGLTPNTPSNQSAGIFMDPNHVIAQANSVFIPDDHDTQIAKDVQVWAIAAMHHDEGDDDYDVTGVDDDAELDPDGDSPSVLRHKLPKERLKICVAGLESDFDKWPDGWECVELHSNTVLWFSPTPQGTGRLPGF